MDEVTDVHAVKWVTVAWVLFPISLYVFMKSDIHKTCLDVYFLCNWYFVWLFFVLFLFSCSLIVVVVLLSLLLLLLLFNVLSLVRPRFVFWLCGEFPCLALSHLISSPPGNFNAKQLNLLLLFLLSKYNQNKYIWRTLTVNDHLNWSIIWLTNVKWIYWRGLGELGIQHIHHCKHWSHWNH